MKHQFKYSDHFELCPTSDLQERHLRTVVIWFKNVCLKMAHSQTSLTFQKQVELLQIKQSRNITYTYILFLT